jgi:hypothetical protein
MVDDGRDMQILVRVDATNDVSFCRVCCHPILLSLDACLFFAPKDAGTGQSWDRMVMPFLGHGSTFEAKPHRRAFPDDRQVQGKTHVGSIGVRVRSRRKALRHQSSEWSIGV